jgi:hypothetical protein
MKRLFGLALLPLILAVSTAPAAAAGKSGASGKTNIPDGRPGE